MKKGKVSKSLIGFVIIVLVVCVYIFNLLLSTPSHYVACASIDEVDEINYDNCISIKYVNKSITEENKEARRNMEEEDICYIWRSYKCTENKCVYFDEDNYCEVWKR